MGSLCGFILLAPACFSFIPIIGRCATSGGGQQERQSGKQPSQCNRRLTKGLFMHPTQPPQSLRGVDQGQTYLCLP